MNSLPKIVQAEATEADALSTLIAETFHPLTPSEWLVPDPAARQRMFPAYFRLHVEQALKRGSAEVTADRMAVALWFPVAPTGPDALDRYDERLATITGARVDQFHAFDTAMDERHPAGVQHDYLGILAVHPSRQRQGLGSALLAHHHRQLDAQEPPGPAYLEASDETNREWYLRHDYKDLGVPVCLPGGPRMYPMWRSLDRSDSFTG